MTHLRIELNNGTRETVASSVIKKLYDLAKEIELDANGTIVLKGWLYTSATYLDYITYLENISKVNNEPLLTIDVGKAYITFADPAVLSVLVNRYGDGTGVTISNLSGVSLLPPGIFDYNTTIETFNELGLFTNITSMSYDCFRGCTNLRSIDLSNILEFSSGNALNGCSKLGSDNNGILNLPKLNSTLGGSCLASCTSLVEVNIGSNVSSGNKISLIKNSTFSDCTNLEKVTGLSEVTSLESGVFYSCQKLKNLPDLNNSTALSIGDECFFDCFALKCIDLTSLTISLVGKNHFYRCGNLIDLSTNDYTQASSAAATYTFNWSTIPRGIFWGAAITNKSFNFPNATSIGERAFNSSGVVGITFPNVTSIGNNTFSDCTSLTTIDLSNVTSIGIGAFNGCTSLTSIDISGVTEILGNYLSGAFEGCTSLTTVTGMSNPRFMHTFAFRGCTSLGNNLDLVLNLLRENSTKTSVNAAYTFERTKYKSAEIHCQYLLEAGYMFSNCPNLKKIDLSDTNGILLTDFCYYSAVETIILPANNPPLFTWRLVSDCYSLTKVIILSSAPPALETTQLATTWNARCLFYVPDAALTTYQTTTGWDTITDRIHGLSSSDLNDITWYTKSNS